MSLARFFSLWLIALILTAWGASPAKKIDGTWNASWLNSNSSVAYTFAATPAQGNGTTVNVSNFNFTSAAPCFTVPLGQSATFSATGHSGGYQTGPFGMSIDTGLMTPVGNVLTLTGTRNADGSISGKWTLTGLSRCSTSGSYNMNQFLSM
jgi:hypothetical protein